MRMRMLTAIMLLVIIMVVPAMAEKPPDAPNGAVMATDNTGNPDAILFPGTPIYIVGHKLTAGAPFSWIIQDMDNGNNGVPVGSGSGGTINTDGTISPPFATGWSIPEPDYSGHGYRLTVKVITGPNIMVDFYTKRDSFEPIPEEGTLILTSMGILGTLFISRKYRK